MPRLIRKVPEWGAAQILGETSQISSGGVPLEQVKQVLKQPDDFHQKWYFGEAGRWEEADEASSPVFTAM